MLELQTLLSMSMVVTNQDRLLAFPVKDSSEPSTGLMVSCMLEQKADLSQSLNQPPWNASRTLTLECSQELLTARMETSLLDSETDLLLKSTWRPLIRLPICNLTTTVKSGDLHSMNHTSIPLEMTTKSSNGIHLQELALQLPWSTMRLEKPRRIELPP
jgi:hypothetical protein